MVADCYKLGQDRAQSSREDDGKRRAGLPLCDVTNYELVTSVAHIKVSLGLHNTSYCEADRGGERDFTRFLQPISRQEMMVMLVVEPGLLQQRQTQISCCSVCLRGGEL